MSRDPFELLSRFRPVELDRTLEPGENPAADALLRDIAASDPNPRDRRHWRRWAVGGVSVVVIVGSGVAVAARWLDRPADTVTLSCYSEAAPEPDVQVGLMIDPDSTPEAQCARLWTDGALGSGPVPPLTSCVTREGITAVIPGEQGDCERIGFADRDPSVNSGGDDAARVASAVVERYPTTCVASTGDAVAMIESIIADLRVTGWEVRAAGETSADRPCAYPGVDADKRLILVVPAAALD